MLLGLMVREAGRVVPVPTALPRVFFVTGRDSGAVEKAFFWSPSDAISMWEDFRFLPLPAGGAMALRTGEAGFGGCDTS